MKYWLKLAKSISATFSFTIPLRISWTFIYHDFVWYDSLHPSQQFFSYVGSNQYHAEDKVSCSRTQPSAHSEAQTPKTLNLEPSTLPLSYPAPLIYHDIFKSIAIFAIFAGKNLLYCNPAQMFYRKSHIKIFCKTSGSFNLINRSSHHRVGGNRKLQYYRQT